MAESTDLIEKIWWVIPPVVIVLGIPLVYTFKEMMEFTQPMNLFIWCYGKNLFVYIRNLPFLVGSLQYQLLGLWDSDIT